jgi:SAM-dependent methyltransferase
MFKNPDMLRGYFEANREAWNKKTRIHKNSSFYDLEGFKSGKTSLKPPELSEMGDVHQRSLLHLQCHFGLDSLSWARMGSRVTGVDFSEEAITAARQLSEEVNVPAEFICCNIYDLPLQLSKKFDIVFTSYGVLGWLPDIDNWAGIVSNYLTRGGIFYMIEFHPFVWMMDENFERIKYYYHNQQTIADVQTGTYAEPDAKIEYEEYSWNHSLSEVVNALIRHGLQIEFLTEFPFSSYNCFKGLVQGEDGNWRVQGLENKIPMMYSIRCVKLF